MQAAPVRSHPNAAQYLAAVAALPLLVTSLATGDSRASITTVRPVHATGRTLTPGTTRALSDHSDDLRQSRHRTRTPPPITPPWLNPSEKSHLWGIYLQQQAAKARLARNRHLSSQLRRSDATPTTTDLITAAAVVAAVLAAAGSGLAARRRH